MKADYQTADQHREVTKEVIEKKEQVTNFVKKCLYIVNFFQLLSEMLFKGRPSCTGLFCEDKS